MSSLVLKSLPERKAAKRLLQPHQDDTTPLLFEFSMTLFSYGQSNEEKSIAPSKQIIQPQDFFNQSQAVLIALHAKNSDFQLLKKHSQDFSQNLADLNFISCQIDENNINLADYKIETCQI